MIRDIERQERQRVAKRYRDQGYTVLTETSAARVLPEKLQGIVPDLVARRGEENIIVEIKTRGVDESRDRLIRLAEAVERHPNWRFHVHLLEPEAGQARTPPGKKAVTESLESATTLFEQGHRVAALLLLWSALEAAGETALQELGVEVSASWEHESLGAGLAFHGLLEDDAYERWRDLRRIRNLAAHGKVDLVIDEHDFEFLVGVTRHLIGPS